MAMTTFFPSLTVSDMQRSVRFYEEALGFTTTFSIPGPDGNPGFVSLANGTASLMLDVPRTEDQVPAEAGSVGRGVNLYVSVESDDDIDGLFDRAKEAGARVVQGPTDEFWGDRDWTVADPDGYLITVGKPVRDVSPEDMIAAATSSSPAG